ncbi:MAG: hypothetical protein J6M53_01225 [Bacteroidaceae bacterium]|nr:hypothetical protein [Bacteroidaceae bacterium]
MKHLFQIAALFALFLMGAGLATAQTVSDEPVQDAMYVYRNDGKFHGFYNFEVVRVEFSKIDTLGREHFDYVVQEIETLDSLYRIPISAIDSVSYVTPRTEYAPDVKATTTSQLWDYVVGSDSLTQLLLSPATPAGLIPAVGDKLCTTKSRNYLPGGFYGTVQSVSQAAGGTLVQCKREEFKAYLKRHMFKGGLSINEDEQRAVRRRALARRRAGHDSQEAVLRTTLDTITGSGSYDMELFKINDNWSIKGEGGFEVAIVPTIYAAAFGSFDATTGLNMNVAMHVNAEISLDLSAKAAIEGSLDIPLATHIHWIPDTPFFLTAQAGINTGISGELELKYHETDTIAANMQVQINESLFTDNVVVGGNAKLLGSSNKMEATGTVTVQAGPYYKVQFLLGTEDIGKLELRIDAGLKSSIEAEIKTKALEEPVDSVRTWPYEILNRDNTFKMGTFAKVGWSAKFYHWEDDGTLWEKDRTWDFQGGLVPQFQAPQVYYDAYSRSLSVSCNVDRSVFPLTSGTLGFALYNEKGQPVGQPVWDTRRYFQPTLWNSYWLTIPNVEPDQWYTVHPLCHLMGFELTARPATRFFAGEQDLFVSPDSLKFDHTGGFGFISVKNTFSDDLTVGDSYWSDSPRWFNYAEGEGGYNVSVSPNEGYKRRIETIGFTARDPNNMFNQRYREVVIYQDIDPAYIGLIYQGVSPASYASVDGETDYIYITTLDEDLEGDHYFGSPITIGDEDVKNAFEKNPIIHHNADGTFSIDGVEGLSMEGKFDPVAEGEQWQTGSGTFKLATDFDHHRKSKEDVETAYHNGFAQQGGEALVECLNPALDEHFKRDVEGTFTITWDATKQQYLFRFTGTGTVDYSATCYKYVSGIKDNGNIHYFWEAQPDARITGTVDYTTTANTEVNYGVYYLLNE